MKMSNASPQKTCLACHRSADEVPLIPLDYHGATYWICPQDFPVMIHRPADLIGKLPGAEKLNPSEIDD